MDSHFGPTLLGSQLRSGDDEGLATLPDDQWEGAQASEVVAVAGALSTLLCAVQVHGQEVFQVMTPEQVAALKDAATSIEDVGQAVWDALGTDV